MLQRLRDYWLPWMMFGCALAVAGTLLLLVMVMPFAIERLPLGSLLQLFAHDPTVRRSAIASALGLIVTAFVFFQPSDPILTRRSPARWPTARG